MVRLLAAASASPPSRSCPSRRSRRSTTRPSSSRRTALAAAPTPWLRQSRRRSSGVRPDAVAHPDDEACRASVTRAVTLQFDLDRSIDAAQQDVQAAINARLQPIAGPAADAADVLEEQPCRSAILTPVGQLEHAARSTSRRLRGLHPGAEDLRRCRGVGLVTINGGQKPAVRACRSTRSLSPGPASRSRTCARRSRART